MRESACSFSDGRELFEVASASWVEGGTVDALCIVLSVRQSSLLFVRWLIVPMYSCHCSDFCLSIAEVIL